MEAQEKNLRKLSRIEGATARDKLDILISLLDTSVYSYFSKCNAYDDAVAPAPTSCHLIVVVLSPFQWGWVEMAGQISEALDQKVAPIVMDCCFAGLPVDRSQLGGSSSNRPDSLSTSPNPGIAPN